MSTYKLDITKEHCPMTFVKTRLELDKLKPGDRLEVLLSEGEPLDNVPKSVSALGYDVIETAHAGGKTHKVVIEKCENQKGSGEISGCCGQD
jgi:TusA-related sulfurtransferase